VTRGTVEAGAFAFVQLGVLQRLSSFGDGVGSGVRKSVAAVTTLGNAQHRLE